MNAWQGDLRGKKVKKVRKHGLFCNIAIESSDYLQVKVKLFEHLMQIQEKNKKKCFDMCYPVFLSELLTGRFKKVIELTKCKN